MLFSRFLLASVVLCKYCFELSIILWLNWLLFCVFWSLISVLQFCRFDLFTNVSPYFVLCIGSDEDCVLTQECFIHPAKWTASCLSPPPLLATANSSATKCYGPFLHPGFGVIKLRASGDFGSPFFTIGVFLYVLLLFFFSQWNLFEFHGNTEVVDFGIFSPDSFRPRRNKYCCQKWSTRFC